MTIVFTALGVLSVLYGVSIMLIHSGTSFFAIWYAIGAFFLVCAWVNHAHLWDAIPAFVKAAGLGALGLLVAVLLFTQGLAVSQFGAKGEPDLDYIVVLGAQVHDDGSPSLVLQYRLDTALDYLAHNPSTRCIVSGGQGPNETMPEAAGMANYLAAHGIERERILVEDRSQNTMQNIAYSRELMDAPECSVGIVTNNFHVYRSVKIAQKAGLENACGIAAHSTLHSLPNNMLREGLGIVKDYLVGNL